MRIAVDLDGVCYEFQRTYRYMMREYRGVDMPPVDEFWTTWDAPDAYADPADRKWMWKEGVELGLFRYGHMVRGARRGLESLVDYGHTLQIVTHRPRNAVTDTLDWVSLYFKGIPLDGFAILTEQEPKSTVSADILIDDKMENVEEWAATGRHAVLFAKPYNHLFGRTIERVQRVEGWEGVVDAIA